MSNLKNELGELLNKSKSAPILFIGSGLSRRYLGLEDWNGLLKKFCDGLPKKFNQYSSMAQGNSAQTASLMSKDYFDYWWSNDKFVNNREKFEEQINKVDYPLKIEICEYLKTKKTNIEKYNKEIEDLKKIHCEEGIDTVITTNWDDFLEQHIFTSYQVFKNQDDLLASEHIGIEELYKIHGCITEPESIILTAEDYQNFNKKYAYLSAKLLTSFIEHPIIFLGYSLNDENIREILKNIALCLPNKYMKRLENNLIFVKPIFDETEDKIYKDTLTIDSVSVTRIIVEVKDYSNIYEAILKYKRRFPLKLVKRMRQVLYDIIIDNNPNNQIIAGDIDNLDKMKEADFVVGIGMKERLDNCGISFAERGVTGLNYDEILIDVMTGETIGNDNIKYAVDLVENKLKSLSYYPIYKYLKIGGYYNIKELDEILNKRNSRGYKKLFCSNHTAVKTTNINTKYNSISEILNDSNLVLNTKLKYITYLENEKINSEELRKCILMNIQSLSDKKCKFKSDIRKLIKIYDFLVYREEI